MTSASMISWSEWTGCRLSHRSGTQKQGPATTARHSHPWPTRWSASRWESTWPVRGRTRRGPRTWRRLCGRSTSAAETQPNWRGRMSGRRRRMQGQSPVGQCLGQEEPRHHPTLPSWCQFLVNTMKMMKIDSLCTTDPSAVTQWRRRVHLVLFLSQQFFCQDKASLSFSC